MSGTDGLPAGTRPQAATGAGGQPPIQKTPGEIINDIIVKVLNAVLDLNVTTIIGPVTAALKPDSTDTALTFGEGKQTLAKTMVNMANGQATVVFSPEFWADAEMRKVHDGNVQLGRDVRDQTIAVLKTAVESFEHLFAAKTG